MNGVLDRGAQILRLMGHPQRLAIIGHLCNGPASVSAIGRALDLGQPMLSQYLSELRDGGLVSATRRSRNVIYEISEPSVAAILTALFPTGCTAVPLPPSRRDDSARFAVVEKPR